MFPMLRISADQGWNLFWISTHAQSLPSSSVWLCLAVDLALQATIVAILAGVDFSSTSSLTQQENIVHQG